MPHQTCLTHSSFYIARLQQNNQLKPFCCSLIIVQVLCLTAVCQCKPESRRLHTGYAHLQNRKHEMPGK